jgi:hypothetical protein
VLIPKDELSELERVKRDYFERINFERKKAMKMFKIKNLDMCIYHIDLII